MPNPVWLYPQRLQLRGKRCTFEAGYVPADKDVGRIRPCPARRGGAYFRLWTRPSFRWRLLTYLFEVTERFGRRRGPS